MFFTREIFFEFVNLLLQS